MAYTLRMAVMIYCLLIAGLVSAELHFPKLTGRVVDNANMLNSGEEKTLSVFLAEHESASSNQVVVVTVPNLQSSDIESYANLLARHWGIGQKDKNNGVLLLVAKQERKIRIEVGYGLEGQLTDAISANIINTVITPAFKKGDFSAGINAGARAIVAAIGGEYAIKKHSPAAKKNNKFWMFIFLMIIFWPMLGMILPSSFIGNRSGRGYGGYGGGGFGGGGGGFSGGGGSFGGGGASGGW